MFGVHLWRKEFIIWQDRLGTLTRKAQKAWHLSGAVRVVMEETVETHFESVTGFEVRKTQNRLPFAKTGSGQKPSRPRRAFWRQVLWGSEELLWYSQRDDWGNLYLYDLNSETFAPFLYIKWSFYQDRLGTNIGKTQKSAVLSRYDLNSGALKHQVTPSAGETNTPFRYHKPVICQDRLGTNGRQKH
eukprot:COSAG06_NODE_518_length_14769_cov_75.390048_11_plen_187_part_00